MPRTLASYAIPAAGHHRCDHPEASLEVRAPIVHATLIIVASTLPIFFLGGVAGSFFQPLAFAYAMAILASMIVALTITSSLALILLWSAARLPCGAVATGALMSLMWMKAAGDVLPSHLERVGRDQKTMGLAARNPT
ncbi:MAG: efflux RND transporter permease subunit [Gammaproteobacteria bacterium]